MVSKNITGSATWDTGSDTQNVFEMTLGVKAKEYEV
jgi:hypothetical protein